MNSPLELRNYIEQLAIQNKAIQRFYYGDYDDIIGAERNTIDYPLLWMESPEVRPRNIDHFNLEYSFAFLVLMNAPPEDKERQLENSTSTFNIAMSILSRIQLDEEENDLMNFEIDDVDMQEVSSAAIGNNNETGWRISMKLYTYVEHCYDPSEWGDERIWNFEGTMTVGSLLGEGGITAYGFKNFGGEQFGSLENFYTFYEYQGLYYVDGTLFVWGVDVSILCIDGTEYTDGEYNENGYTEFEITENPFTGATAEIKIQGTATETWDYEGVMTVGEDIYEPIDGYGYFGYSTDPNINIGTLIPTFNSYNDKREIRWDNEETGLYISAECEIININGNIITPTKYLGYCFNALPNNPFPEAGETCTIKIKL